MSHAFYRLADLRVAPGLTVDSVKGQNQTALKALTEYDGLDDDGKPDGKKDKYILPAFPVAMAIAKDITIKVKMEKTSSSSAKQVVENSSGATGGFFCFSVSGASSSKSSSEATFHGSQGEYYYIRIPGPQVIGYFLQFLPQDNSEPYKALTSPSGSSPVLDAFQLFDNADRLIKGEVPLLNSSVSRVGSATNSNRSLVDMNPLILPTGVEVDDDDE